jgi:hypothetical protein
MVGLMGVSLLVLIACASEGSGSADLLDPKVQLTMEADGRTVVRIGVCNTGTQDFAGDKYFAGQVSLFDENEHLVECATLEQLGPVASRETVFPLELKAALPAGSYRLAYSTASFLTADARFTIVEQGGARYLKATPQLISPQTDFTIVEGD